MGTNTRLTLLRKFQASKATDERDKIYALLGMCPDPLDTKNLIIDYRRPTSQVVHEAITYLLQSKQTISSNPFTIHEILKLMSSFATLDVAYFIPAQDVTLEAIYHHLQLGNKMAESNQPEVKFPAMVVANDPKLLFLEERPAENLDNSKTCYSQIVELMRTQQPGRAPQDYV